MSNYTATPNTNTYHDDSWSNWHYLYGRSNVCADIDTLISTDDIAEEVVMEYMYKNNEIQFVAIMDHKSGAGSSDKSTKWSAMQMQLALAKKLDIPFFMSIDYLLPQFPEPTSYLIGVNDKAKAIIGQWTKGKGIWLPPYYYCRVLHELRGIKFNGNELINEKHKNNPRLQPIIEKYNLVKLGDLPKTKVKYDLPDINF
jgi:hypothetical protein